MKSRKLASAALVIGGLGLAGSAYASTEEIKAAGDKAATPSPGSSAPTAVEPGIVARYDLSGDHTLNFNADQTTTRMLVGDDEVTLELEGHAWELTSPNRTTLTMGLRGWHDSRLNILNGRVDSIKTILGRAEGSRARLTIGAGTDWYNSGLVRVGGDGVGMLTVMDGGRAATDNARIGRLPGTSGMVVLDGNGSFWAVQRNLLLAEEGSGSLVVRKGATVNVANRLAIGSHGTLRVEGGTVTAATLAGHGHFRFTSGTINVTRSDLDLGRNGPLGAGLFLHSAQSLNVSNGMNVESGGSLTLGGGIFSATSLANRGRVRLTTGTSSLDADHIDNFGQLGLEVASASVAGDVTNAAGGVINVKGALARFQGDVAQNGTVFTASGSTSEFYGDVSGRGDFTGAGHVVFHGTYSPGAGPAAISMGGSAAFKPGSKLMLDLGAPDLSGAYPPPAGAINPYDRLAAVGKVDLGDVKVALSPYFVPMMGDRYELVTGSQVNHGGTVEVPSLDGGLAFRVIQNDHSLALVVIPEPATWMLGVGIVVPGLLRRRRDSHR